MKKIKLIITYLSPILVILIGYYLLSPFVKVVRVIDGDTFTTADHRTIRILEIDTAEINTSEGIEAKLFTSRLILNKIVKLDCWKKDIYERDLCYVYVDGESVSQKIIDAGLSKRISIY